MHIIGGAAGPKDRFGVHVEIQAADVGAATAVTTTTIYTVAAGKNVELSHISIDPILAAGWVGGDIGSMQIYCGIGPTPTTELCIFKWDGGTGQWGLFFNTPLALVLDPGDLIVMRHDLTGSSKAATTGVAIHGTEYEEGQ